MEKNNKMESNGKGNRWNAMKRKDGNTTERNKNGQILLNRKRAGFGRIFGMEIGDNVRSVSKFIGG